MQIKDRSFRQIGSAILVLSHFPAMGVACALLNTASRYLEDGANRSIGMFYDAVAMNFIVITYILLWVTGRENARLGEHAILKTWTFFVLAEGNTCLLAVGVWQLVLLIIT
jgi:hypothetical protein